MTLITDGGSTKCDWVLLDADGKVILKSATAGLNPAIFPREELYSRISENEDLKKVFHQIEVLDFYGAGCGTETAKNILKDVLVELFPKAKVQVFEDTNAAVYAVTTEPGIVCILGTGSNSCYFDGGVIHAPIPSLGYVLMDEASGNHIGKRLIRDYYYKRMPQDIAAMFSEQYNLEADEIKLNLYKKANPNAYLASFAEFIFNPSNGRESVLIEEWEDEKINPYFYNLIKDGISAFIECRILSFENAHELPIHFIGSIAYFSKEIIAECLEEQELQLGKIVQRPIDGMIEYYRKKILS
ncbi:MAG: N-acetylglucosamine kinase [Aequorivita sp.]